jgi:nitrogen fixation-related uncharacterized protein
MCSCFRQTLEKTKGATKNGQYRDTGNIGQTKMVNTETLETLGKQEWSIQKHWKHWANKNGQYRDTGNIGQPRMVNTETLETLGKQDTGRRETKQKQPQHRKLKR